MADMPEGEERPLLKLCILLLALKELCQNSSNEKVKFPIFTRKTLKY
jgi:hypothetical protein